MIRSFPKITLLSFVVLTVGSVDRALKPTLVVVRMVIWLRTTYSTGVRLEVILNLVLIHMVQQQSSLLRGTGSSPECHGRAGELH